MDYDMLPYLSKNTAEQLLTSAQIFQLAAKSGNLPVVRHLYSGMNAMIKKKQPCNQLLQKLILPISIYNIICIKRIAAQTFADHYTSLPNSDIVPEIVNDILITARL